MSKSLGNFFTIREVLAKYDAETVRFFIVRAHYRSALNYSDAHLDDAKASLSRLQTAVDLVGAKDIEIDWANPFAARFKSAMDEDFATPAAVAVLFELASEVNKTQSGELAGLLKKLGGCLGLLQRVSAGANSAGTSMLSADGVVIPVEDLIAQRAAAKAAKDFVTADRIRNDLLAQGIVLKDTPGGTTWEVKS